MAINGATDTLATVTVPKPEYEELVRDSEQLAIIRRMVSKGKYFCQEDLKAILDVEEPPRGCEKPKTFEEMLGEKEGEE